MHADELDVADVIIDLVRHNPPEGGIRGDTGEAVMFGTYVRAFRRFIRIRDLARDDAGEEVMILARSLLSMIARAIWIDWPGSQDERRSRFERWKKRELTDELKEVRGLKTAGFPVTADLAVYESELAKLKDVRAMPGDADLLIAVGLNGYYARVYRLGSKHLHYTLQHATGELLAAVNAGEDLPLERPDPELTAEALVLSILTYAMFLDAAEGTVKHGLTPRVAELLVASPAFPDFPGGGHARD
jgi:Family of unknown function (DUF5677)